MAVAAADEDEMFDYGGAGLHTKAVSVCREREVLPSSRRLRGRWIGAEGLQVK